jgi:hypothetical protein
MSRAVRQVVRIVAITLNIIVLLLEWNIEVQTRLHPNLHVDWSWAGRVSEFAPLFALVALLWPTRTRSTG